MILLIINTNQFFKSWNVQININKNALFSLIFKFNIAIYSDSSKNRWFAIQSWKFVISNRLVIFGNGEALPLPWISWYSLAITYDASWQPFCKLGSLSIVKCLVIKLLHRCGKVKHRCGKDKTDRTSPEQSCDTSYISFQVVVIELNRLACAFHLEEHASNKFLIYTNCKSCP